MTMNNSHNEKKTTEHNDARFFPTTKPVAASNPYLDTKTEKKIQDWQKKVVMPSKL